MSMISPEAELSALTQIRASLEEKAQNLINILNSKPIQDNAIALDLRDVNERLAQLKERELILSEQIKFDDTINDSIEIPTEQKKGINPLFLLGGLGLILLL